MTHEKWEPNVDAESLMKQPESIVNRRVKPQPVKPGDIFSFIGIEETFFILSIDKVFLENRFAVVTCISSSGRLLHTSLDSLSISLGMLTVMHTKDT